MADDFGVNTSAPPELQSSVWRNVQPVVHDSIASLSRVVREHHSKLNESLRFQAELAKAAKPDDVLRASVTSLHEQLTRVQTQVDGLTHALLRQTQATGSRAAPGGGKLLGRQGIDGDDDRVAHTMHAHHDERTYRSLEGGEVGGNAPEKPTSHEEEDAKHLRRGDDRHVTVVDDAALANTSTRTFRWTLDGRPRADGCLRWYSDAAIAAHRRRKPTAADEKGFGGDGDRCPCHQHHHCDPRGAAPRRSRSTTGSRYEGLGRPRRAMVLRVPGFYTLKLSLATRRTPPAGGGPSSDSGPLAVFVNTGRIRGVLQKVDYHPFGPTRSTPMCFLGHARAVCDVGQHYGTVESSAPVPVLATCLTWTATLWLPASSELVVEGPAAEMGFFHATLESSTDDMGR